MNLRKFIIILLGIVTLVVTTGLSLNHLGISLNAYNKIDKLDKRNKASKKRSAVSEAPIVFLSEDNHMRSVSIQKDDEEQAILIEEFLDHEKSRSIDINTESGYQFNTPINTNVSVQESVYTAADSIVVISDLDGNFDAFASLLFGNGITDEAFNWTYGNNQLVILGDVFDRGDEVFECLWLIYKLEKEALQAGGSLHFILGNHEIMNLTGNFNNKSLKYVHRKYYRNEEFVNIPYTQWISSSTVIGQWLRTKNCMEQIGNMLFLHGGISYELLKTGLNMAEINQLNRELIDLNPDQYAKSHKLIIGRDGPLWNRDMALAKLNDDEINEILDHFEVKRIVIGHTINERNEITPLYDGKIIPVDLDHKTNFKRGIISTLFIKNGLLFEINNKGELKKL
jgi:hypothetical protein